MTLASDLLAETKAHLLAGAREELNTLAGAVTDTTSTTWNLTYDVGSIQKGAVLSVDLELVYVWSVAVAAKQVTVQRGHLGSTAATHANGSVVTVNPRFSDFAVFRALNEEIRSFSAPANGLYRLRTMDLTYSAARTGYDLTGVTNLIDIYSVEATGIMAGDLDPIRQWRLVRNQVASDFASGFALVLFEGVTPGKNLRVTYKAPYTALSAVTDDVESITGLHAEAHDIPPLGAAGRLLTMREVRRSTLDAQPEPRQATEVPPGTARGAAAGLFGLRAQRLREESTRLHARYPTLVRT